MSTGALVAIPTAACFGYMLGLAVAHKVYARDLRKLQRRVMAAPRIIFGRRRPHVLTLMRRRLR